MSLQFNLRPVIFDGCEFHFLEPNISQLFVKSITFGDRNILVDLLVHSRKITQNAGTPDFPKACHVLLA